MNDRVLVRISWNYFLGFVSLGFWFDSDLCLYDAIHFCSSSRATKTHSVLSANSFALSVNLLLVTTIDLLHL